jgi:hypothetical protein
VRGGVSVRGLWTETYAQREAHLRRLVTELYELAVDLQQTTITASRLERKFSAIGADFEIAPAGVWQDAQVLYVRWKIDRVTNPNVVQFMDYHYISEPLPTPQAPRAAVQSATQTGILINVPDPENAPLTYTLVTGYEGQKSGFVISVWQDDLGYFYYSTRGKVYLPRKP